MRRRNGNGEGSITRRSDGRWMARVSLTTGRKTFYGRTRSDVDALLTAAKKARDDGTPIPVDRATVASYFADWLESIRPQLRSGTWRKREMHVRLHIAPTLGRVVLAKLSPEHLERLYAAKSAEGLSGQTVRHIHATIHKALAQAERRRHVTRNVAHLVDAPRVEQHEIKAWTEDQANAFLTAVEASPLAPLFVLAITTGMRKGEILALRWRDVDLDRRTIQLRATLERYHGVVRFAEPKTKGSKRKIELTARAVTDLRRQRAAQRIQQLAAGPAWANLDLVFASEAGAPLVESTLRRAFNALSRAAGVPQIRFHDLRHTAFTILLGRGIHAKVVSEMAGHSRISVTMDLYSHVTPTMQREAVSAMEAALGGAR